MLGALALAAASPSAFERSFREAWVPRFMESCGRAAEASSPNGAPTAAVKAVIAEVCGCTAQRLNAEAATVQELIALGKDQSKAMTAGRECMARVDPQAAARMR